MKIYNGGVGEEHFTLQTLNTFFFTWVQIKKHRNILIFQSPASLSLRKIYPCYIWKKASVDGLLLK